jgi:CBS domain-containing protein
MALQAGPMLKPLAVMMNRNLRTIGPQATLADAAKAMQEAKVGALFVLDRGAYVGVVSETDLVRRGMAQGADPAQAQVRSIMSSPIISIESDRSVHDASDLMADRGIRHLAVTQDGQIVGMISVRGLLRYFKNWGPL